MKKKLFILLFAGLLCQNIYADDTPYPSLSNNKAYVCKLALTK